jgi:hypothetical protein
MLQLITEQSMATLFGSTSETILKYETSDVVLVTNIDTTTAFAVCDSSWSLYQIDIFHNHFLSKSSPPPPPTTTTTTTTNHIQNNNTLRYDPVGVVSPEYSQDDSDYEGITYHNGTFYVVRESIPHYNMEEEDPTYHAIIEELVLFDDGTETTSTGGTSSSSPTTTTHRYQKLRQCSTEFAFEGTSKGFEGIVAIQGLRQNQNDQDNNVDLYLVGLCEGNHCSETYKHDRGHGKLVIMQRQDSSMDSTPTKEESSCVWKTIRTIDIPSSAYFHDYSAISLHVQNDYVAITSQEDSLLWIGRLLGRQPQRPSTTQPNNESTDLDDAVSVSRPVWNIDEMIFDQFGQVFAFPTNEDCDIVYCNIGKTLKKRCRGLWWLSPHLIVSFSNSPNCWFYMFLFFLCIL